MKKNPPILSYHFAKSRRVNVYSVFAFLNFLFMISTVHAFQYWSRLAPIPPVATGLSLDCKSSLQCLLYVPNSQCNWDSRKCECQSYHIPNANNTECLPGVLLTYECEIDAQCSLKVPNSKCLNGRCACKENHTKIRLDKCMPPATLGDYCLNDEMCSSSDVYSTCKWIVRGAYGKCKCLPDHFYSDLEKKCYPKLGQQCFKNTDCDKATKHSKCGNMSEQKNTMIVVKASIRKHNNKDKLLNKSKYSNQISHLSSNHQSLSNHSTKLSHTAKTGYRTVSRQSKLTKKFKDTQILNTCRCASNFVENEDKTKCIKEESRLTAQSPSISSPIAAASNMVSDRYIEKLSFIPDNPTFNLFNASILPVSIGKKCSSDFECRLRDQYSQCKLGYCTCINPNSKCSSKNNGCHKDTFQCRDGTCISWYFVCNGYNECSDGSDELECVRHNCPPQSFQCDDGFCIQKAKKCNGKKECLDGSDEKYCEEHNCSSKDSFRCSNGQCLPKYTFCNQFKDCDDGSDENPNICETNSSCPADAFQCSKNKKCRSTAILCSQAIGCGDGEDESKCSSCYCDKPNIF